MNRDTMQAHLQAKHAQVDAMLEKFKQSVFPGRFESEPGRPWASRIMRQ
jgi:hypothetical protein